MCVDGWNTAGHWLIGIKYRLACPQQIKPWYCWVNISKGHIKILIISQEKSKWLRKIINITYLPKLGVKGTFA